MSYYDRSLAFSMCNSWKERAIVESILQEVDKMINENVPKVIEQYLNQNKERMILDIETSINGHMIDSDSISRAIQEEVLNRLKF